MSKSQIPSTKIDVVHGNKSDPLLIPAKEVARILGISERTVWRHQSSGTIPKPVRIGGNVRWRADEIREWVAAGCPE
jgi:excisionase family DNA binding protein